MQSTPNPTQTFNDAIPGDRAEEVIKALHDHRSRLVIKEVVEEHLNSTDFSDKVKRIQHEALEADPARDKLKQWVVGLITAEMTSDATRARFDSQIDTRITTQLDDRGWKKKNLWVPATIGIITGIIGLIGIVVSAFNLQEAQKANDSATIRTQTDKTSTLR